MRLTICAIGRMKNSAEKTLFDDYIKRLAWPITLRELELKSFSAKYSSSELKSREAALIRTAIPAGATIVALDEHGKDLPSRQFAGHIKQWQDSGIQDIAFLIGGADGLDESLRRDASLMIAFGRATWPHMLVRAMLAEQLYRIGTIIAGHPYHRD